MRLSQGGALLQLGEGLLQACLCLSQVCALLPGCLGLPVRQLLVSNDTRYSRRPAVPAKERHKQTGRCADVQQWQLAIGHSGSVTR